MSERPTLLEFIEDPRCLGLGLSPYQRTLVKVVRELDLTAEELAIYRECTGRTMYRPTRFGEITVIAGARSGKDSRIAVPIALYEAIFGNHEHHLGRGERATVPIVAQDQKGTEVAFEYIKSYLLESSELRAMLAEEPRVAEVRLTNKTVVRCFACTAKTLRAVSIPAAILDEVAFFRAEAGSNADVEILTAVRRGMINFPAPRLVKISTPFGQEGILYQDMLRYWGKDDPDVLVWKATTQQMNPGISAARIAAERRKDPERARREYDAEFGADVGTAFPEEWITAAVVEDGHERGPMAEIRYVAAVDPSGGGADSFTLAIVHHDAGRMIHHVMRGWRSPNRGDKLDLGAVCTEIAGIVRPYGLSQVIGDKYAGEWPAQKFRDSGLTYTPAEIDKSKAFLELTPWLAQHRMDMLDQAELVQQLKVLEKRLKPGGKFPVYDHPRGGHDDYPTAVALAVAILAGSLHPAIDIGVDARGRRIEASNDPHAAPDSGGGFHGRVPDGLLARHAARQGSAVGRSGRERFWR